jgi:hypothetical protein
MPAGDVAVTPVFTRKKHKLMLYTQPAEGGGSIRVVAPSPVPTDGFTSGTTTVFHATSPGGVAGAADPDYPDFKWTFSGGTAPHYPNGVTTTTDNPLSFSWPKGSFNATANYGTRKKWKVTLVAAAGTTISHSGNATTAIGDGVYSGTAVTFTVSDTTPNSVDPPNLIVTGADDTNNAIGTATFYMPKGDVTVRSVRGAAKPKYTVQHEVSGGPTKAQVKMTPETATAMIAGSTYQLQISLADTPPGYKFKGWQLTGGATILGGPTTMSADQASISVMVPATNNGKVTAVYEEIRTIIYYDSTTQTLQLGRWGSQITMSNWQQVMMFFKFGSTVGFVNPLGTGWNASYVKFNPTDQSYDASQNDIPCYDTAQDYDVDGITNVSDMRYHAGAPSGKGDPCKLVGLTLTQIRNGIIDNKLYRLPTKTEIDDFVGTTQSGYGYGHFTMGIIGHYTFMSEVAQNTELPATGYREGSVVKNVLGGKCGCYWGSTVNTTDVAGLGESIYFYQDDVRRRPPLFKNDLGQAVRCVKQTQQTRTAE